MRALVTGAAGFIGSHLVQRLLDDGHDVAGIDSFTEYYARPLKERNLAPLLQHDRFRFSEADVATVDLSPLIDQSDVVFHLAAQPGVRASWGDDFRLYLERNLWATQRLLEAVREKHIKKLVFASSSSVYGDAERYPTAESDLPRPISPYGVTKLAGERLCLAYHRSYGVPVMAVRYFTVYGPRQRPDMAFSKFLQAIHEGREIGVYGDGKQTRDFTFVSDAVEATVQSAFCDAVGEALNVGGGARVTLLDVLDTLASVTGTTLRLNFVENQRGDVRDTAADVSLARELIGYRPRVSLDEGLRQQADWWARARQLR